MLPPYTIYQSNIPYYIMFIRLIKNYNIIDSPFSGFMIFYYFTFSCLMTKRNLTV